MKRVAFLASFVLASVLGIVPAVPAHAEPEVVVAGNPCAMQQTEPGRALVQGGPVYGGSDARPVTSVYLLCTIQTGDNSRHADPDATVVTSWGMGATSVPPTMASYPASPGEKVYMCSEAWIWVPPDIDIWVWWDTATGAWSFNDEVECAVGSLLDHGPSGSLDYLGGCGFDSGTDPTGEIANPDTHAGAIYAVAAGFDGSIISGNPATTSITCVLKVNGAVVDVEGPFTGTPVAIGAGDTSFVALDGDVVELCDHVIVNGHDFGVICGTADQLEIPPQEFWDIIDPIVCDALVALYNAGVAGTWDAEGDIDGLYDCPPYGV